MSFVHAMDAEIADLERKLAAVRAARVAYLQVADGPANQSTTREPSFNSLSKKLESITQARASVSRRSEHSARILGEACDLISLRGGPIPTVEVLKHLQSLGIEPGGTNKQNALSAMLSNSGMFISVGREGWTIKEPPAQPKNAEATDALFPNQEASVASIEPRLTSEGTPQRGQEEPWPGGGT